MPLNPNIILEAGNIGARSQDRLRQLFADSRQHLIDTLQMRAYRRDERAARKKERAEERMRELAPTFLSSAGDVNYPNLRRAQLEAGDIAGAIQSQEAERAAAARSSKSELDQLNTYLKKAVAAGVYLRGVKDQESLDEALAVAPQNPLLKGFDWAMIPRQWNDRTKAIIEDLQMQNVSVKDQLSAKLAERRFGETMRHNLAMERRPVGGLGLQRPPSGYRQSAGGGLEFIPGGPADPANKAAERENRDVDRSRAFYNMLYPIDTISGTRQGQEGASAPTWEEFYLNEYPRIRGIGKQPTGAEKRPQSVVPGVSPQAEPSVDSLAKRLIEEDPNASDDEIVKRMQDVLLKGRILPADAPPETIRAQ